MTVDVSARYDRQVRLWGDQGQNSIAEAHIGVIGSSALSSEVLKTLILAGIGSYEILDDQRVQESDFGNNFFITREDVGRYRGEVIAQNLNLMNPSVRGSFRKYDCAPSTSLATFDSFSLVVGANCRADLAVRISDYLYEQNIPFVWANTVGLLGYTRLVYREHEVLHDHREMAPHDFRLHRPFPALLEYVNRFDLDSMDHEHHSHVPYVILYLKALEVWRIRCDNLQALPTSYAQRKEFLSVIMEMQKLNEQGIYNEGNFAEAKEQLTRSFTGFEPPENLRKLFADPRADSSPNDDNEASEPRNGDFWTYVASIRKYYEAHGCLPLSGRLPDMTSDTSTYTTLVDVYRRQARADALEVYENAQRLRNRHYGSGPTAAKCRRKSLITLEDAQHFCKNAPRLNAFSGTRLSDEFNYGIKAIFDALDAHVQQEAAMAAAASPANGESRADDPMAQPTDVHVHPLVWFVVLRAAEMFNKSNGRYPGTASREAAAVDAAELLTHVEMLVKNKCSPDLAAKLHQLVPQRAIDEMCRYGRAELNAVSSIVGSIVSQEIIKLCTHQYLPIDNTLLYDGNSQQSATIRL